jgi:hypothetical protein
MQFSDSASPVSSTEDVAAAAGRRFPQATRDGRRMVYRLRGSHVRALLAEALFQADHQVSGEPTHD